MPLREHVQTQTMSGAAADSTQPRYAKCVKKPTHQAPTNHRVGTWAKPNAQHGRESTPQMRQKNPPTKHPPTTEWGHGQSQMHSMDLKAHHTKHKLQHCLQRVVKGAVLEWSGTANNLLQLLISLVSCHQNHTKLEPCIHPFMVEQPSLTQTILPTFATLPLPTYIPQWYKAMPAAISLAHTPQKTKKNCQHPCIHFSSLCTKVTYIHQCDADFAVLHMNLQPAIQKPCWASTIQTALDCKGHHPKCLWRNNAQHSQPLATQHRTALPRADDQKA